MALKFGTSGVRGLVTDMTDFECYRYARAFGQVLLENSSACGVMIAGDFRNSSPRIMTAVATAFIDLGLKVINGGMIPTPAIALAAMDNSMGAVMVTGSHIPDDRNGIKFYMPWGEILKKDEQQISAAAEEIQKSQFQGKFADDDALIAPHQLPAAEQSVTEHYCERYLTLFPNSALAGLKIVVYQHSTVLREIFPHVLSELGAEVIRVGWSTHFIPLDTEAVQNPEQLAQWVMSHNADALVSADGDGDRPLVVTSDGTVLRGDVLGVLAAKALAADAVATPVSCNSQVEKSNYFQQVVRTRIGSPFVIEAMNELLDDYQAVVGYEANGGFLTGSTINIQNTELKPLPTRDAVLPALMVLVALKSNSWSDMLEQLPNRMTDSLLLRNVNMKAGRELLTQMSSGLDSAQDAVGKTFGEIKDLNTTDGVRLTFTDDSVVHFRPSGNAPEFRAYIESDGPDTVTSLKDKAEQFLLSKIS